MANISIRRQLSGYGLPVLRRGIAQVRRYPIISMAILFIVLVGPAIFANWVAPHDPVVGSLRGGAVHQEVATAPAPGDSGHHVHPHEGYGDL